MTERKYLVERIGRVGAYSHQHSPRLPYHNFAHEVEVARAAGELARLEGLPGDSQHLLETAAYLHDVVFDLNAQDNEERSAESAGQLLPSLGYNPQEVQVVQGLIMATKLPTRPANLMEQIICDADLDNLGTEAFFEKDRLLRRERGLTAAEHTVDWYMGSLKFLESHRYYTDAAKRLRNSGLEKNTAKVREILINSPR